MDNQELRRMKEQLGLINYKINYKTGVHLGVIEDFFSGKTEELAPKDRERIEALIQAEAKKR
jgi:predicted NUDIX family phosphoesterase